MRSSIIAVLTLACAMAAVCPRAQADPSPSPSPAPVPSASPTPVPGRFEPIVVTAQRHPIAIDATSRQTYVVTQEDLERLGAVTAADVLRLIPGTVVQEYGSFGSLATVALRGASTSQTLVLIDGQPANQGDTGIFDFASLPAGSIERIEVVEGGSSTLYGSAAMGGVINIITAHPVNAGAVNASAQWGYRGSFTGALGVTLGGPDLLARVRVQTTSSRGGFSYPAFGSLYPAGERTDSDAKGSDAAVSFSGHLGVVDAEASLQNDTSAVGTPGSVFFASQLAQQQRIYQRMNATFTLPLRRGDIVVQTASDGRRVHFFDTTQPFPFDTQANGEMRAAGVRTTLLIGAWNVVTAGYDTLGDSATFYSALVPPNAPLPGACQGGQNFGSCIAHDAESAWYLQDELHAPGSRLTLDAGLRQERAQGVRPVAVPSFGAAVRLTTAVDAIANYARAFRTPDLDERYFPGFGNPLLQPEYGATFDVGLRTRGGRSEGSVSYFGQDTTNLIVNVPVDAFGDVQPFNVSRARVRGAEASADLGIGSYAHAHLAYSDFLRAADLTPGNAIPVRLLYRPTSTAAFGLWVARGSWDYGLDSTFVGRRYADERNTQLMQPYLLTGAHVKKILTRRLAVTLRVDNVGNDHHAEDVLGYPVVGSAFSLRLSTR